MTESAERAVYYTKYHDRLIMGAALVTLGVLVLAGVLEGVRDASLVAAVVIAIGGGLFFIAGREALRREPRLIISEDGLWYRDWEIEAVPWRDVGNIFVMGSKFKRDIAIELREPQAFVNDRTEQERTRLKRNRLFRPPHLLISVGAMTVKGGDLLTDLRYVWDAGREPS